MFQQDYLMRIFLQFAEAIRRSMEKANGKLDPASAAEMLETAIGEATELDGGVLLSLAPESIASILSVSGTDPRVVEYIARSLLLESRYLEDAGDTERAALRASQARALADSYGIDLTEESISAEEFETLFEESKKGL
ncbi:hypothetical protein [Raoultibacter phocaeensis]|uniref:hypothetical protein n=1 Tax=Raoultibacter phocaeensis TaxID=2479841 RepID=UPI00111AC818|nr:hypothetical protein [Raoultibacter phocaeensis]